MTDLTESFTHARTASGALFFDDQDRVMLVVPSYKDYRDIPGGYVEQGETPKQAAAREVQEELGITPPIGRLLVADCVGCRSGVGRVIAGRCRGGSRPGM